MANIENDILLAQTEEWVPRAEAIKQARIVYEHFARYTDQADSIAHLALTVSMGFSPEQQMRLYRSKHGRWLGTNSYYSKGLADPELKLTVRGKVAANMVRPELDGSNLYSYLDEPLVGLDLLKDFYHNLNK